MTVEHLDNGMQIIQLYHGYLACPSEYIALNPDSASDKSFACLVHVHNFLPLKDTYIFFTDERIGTPCYPDNVYEDIYKSLCALSEPFKLLYEQYGGSKNFINSYQAERVTVWPIPIEDDSTFGREYKAYTPARIFHYETGENHRIHM